jgi:hypothetical protein
MNPTRNIDRNFTVELRSTPRAPKPLAVIYGSTILTEAPFVFQQPAGASQPRTIVCVYDGPAERATNGIQLWKVHSNGRRSKMRCSARPDPAVPYVAVEIYE